MLSTLNGTTSFCSVTDATVATPEFGFDDRITFPVLPSNSMPVGGGKEGGKKMDRRNKREREKTSWCVEGENRRQSNLMQY